MDRAERVLLLHDLLTRHRFGLKTAALLAACDCARSTLYRDLGFMRDALGAPVAHEGSPDPIWRYESQGYQLPGVWLSAEELYTLLLAEQLFQRIASDKHSSGLLGEALGPLKPRIRKLLGSKMQRLDRLRVRGVQIRETNQSAFRAVTDAILENHKLQFAYQARSSDRDRLRQVSPQRLTHYRGNWYLDGLEHPGGKLLRYALDRIRRVTVLRDQAGQDLDAATLDAHNAGYGIFSGAIVGTAVIRFSAHAARWVAEERWHPEQVVTALPDGGVELTVPYGHPLELLMDVQRFGAEAEIVGPPALRAQMAERHQQAAARYAG